MLLRHATTLRNLPGVRRRGLLCGKSKGRLPVVWLHTPGRSWWAVQHTVSRHGGPVEAVVILEVDVPRAWLRRGRRRLWYSTRDIPPDRFGRLISFAELAAELAGGRRPVARAAG